MSPRRLFLPLAILATAGLFASCSGIEPVALTVNGDDVSVDAVKSDLDGLAASKTFTEQNGAILIADGVYDPQITAAVLRQRLFSTVFDQEMRRLGLTLQPVTAAVQEQIEASVGGKDNFDDMSPEFKKRLTDSTAAQFTLLDAYKKQVGTAEAYYTANKNEFADTCVSHVLTSELEAAQRARQRLVAGESMRSVAAELSIDTATEGGELGCGLPSRFVEEFAAAARTLPVNELSQPVKSQFGYHVLVVSKRTEKPFAEVKDSVEGRVSSIPALRLDGLIRDAEVTVNPKYGVYVKDDGQNFPSILPAGSAAPPQ